MPDEQTPPPATEPVATATPARERAPRRPVKPLLQRWGIIAGIGLVAAIALFGGGFATGWITSNTIVTSASSEKVPTPTAPPNIAGYNASVIMPDVRGLAPDDAEQVLADAGIDVATVTKTTRPAAGKSGVVIAQVPAFGAPSPATVSLVVSSPATVPTAVGKSATDVITALTALGAQIQRNQVFVPDATVGTVTSITPAAGAALPDVVTIDVTAAPATANLATIDNSGECGSRTSETMDGKKWSNPVTCSTSSFGESATWSINGLVGEVTGTLGIADSENNSSTASVQILGDGKVLATYPVTYGTPIPFTLKTAGVTKLTVTTHSPSGTSPELVIGDFTALGSADDITTLKAQ